MLTMGVDTAETWEAHFSVRGWQSPQDQVAAGFGLYAAPGAQPGVYEEVIDYGSVLSSSRIAATFDREPVFGAPRFETMISVKEAEGDEWRDVGAADGVYASQFRFLRVRITVRGGIATLDNLRVRLDKKLRSDEGRITANAEDAGGTQVFFAVPFIDVQSIMVTAGGTEPLTAVYDFADVPNPVGFKVLVFDANGQRVTAPVSWSAKGI